MGGIGEHCAEESDELRDVTERMFVVVDLLDWFVDDSGVASSSFLGRFPLFGDKDIETFLLRGTAELTFCVELTSVIVSTTTTSGL